MLVNITYERKTAIMNTNIPSFINFKIKVISASSHLKMV